MIPSLPTVQTDYFPLRGGLDLVTQALAIDPGACFDAQNYEIDNVNGGYRRIDGFERFDGRTQPHSVSYWLITCTISSAPAVGDTLTGASSAATGKVLQVNAGSIVLGRVSGTYTAGENLQVGGVTKAVATTTAIENGATTPSDDADYRNLAADDRRADIAAVPGSGNILGVWAYNDVVYAFRNNAGGTAADMYKSTSSGWTQVTFEYEVQFTAGGTATPLDGQTLTQGGVTATIRRVLTRTGAWSGTAAGTFVISVPGGGNFAAGAATVSTSGATVTLSGIQTAITLPPGGRYEFVNANFTGSTATTRMYGVNGVGKAFEFDGTYFVPIRTGMTTDTPEHIAFHKNYLLLSFRGSVQRSSIGTPFGWSPVTGAAEITTGDQVTAMLPQSGDSTTSALAIKTAKSVFMLYGIGTSGEQLVTISPDAGAVAYTAQNLAGAFFMSERGIQNLATTANYGDFLAASVSRLLQPLINTKRSLSVASTVIKERDQYRIFFSDNTALALTVGGKKIAGIMYLDYGRRVTCYCTSEFSDGTERSFFGSTDGYVFRDRVGTSFDGDPIPAWVRLSFNHLKSPRVRKKYQRAVFELDLESYAEVQISYELGFGAAQAAEARERVLTGAGGFWDQFIWGQFTWDTQSVADTVLDLDGTEKNISILVYSNRDQDQSHTLQGVVLHYIPRRTER